MEPPRHPAAGQACAEYVALLALAAVALGAAGAAGAVPAVGERVEAAVRTGICIVAGDVCRPADAAAAGLAPCTLSERRRGSGGGLTVVSIRFGEHNEWAVARRSDGSVVVSRTRDSDAGVSGGFGLEAGPLGLELGVSGSYAFSVASGRAWEFADAPAARGFLAAVARGEGDDAQRWPPTWRFGDVGGEANALAGAQAAGSGLTGLEASADAAVGVRTGRGQTTFYFQSELEGPAPFGTLAAGAQARRGGPLLVEYTRDREGPRELSFRLAEPGRSAGAVVETAGRLDLRDPANRAAAGRLLRHRAPWPPAAAADLHAVVRHTARAGTVERSVYAVHDASRHLAAAARLGLELGVDFDRTRVDRRLVAASAWTQGSRERERADCVTG